MLRNGFHGLLLRCTSLRNFHLYVWAEKRQVYCTPGYCNVSNNPQQAHYSTFRVFWSIFKRNSLRRSTVAMFHSKVNPTTGKLEWCAPEEGDSDLQEDSDISKELFRSQYGDMLHDTERNEKFYAGVRYAVQKAKEMGVEPHVLDIGTGTGLLSLMAAKCGVRNITACEALKPMAKVAKDIVHKNGYQDVITVLPKRSTEMTVGVDGDMKDRANILVTEMFDTELIGEAALSTFLHAHQQLLQKGSIVVPQTATVVVQPVSSTFLHSSHSIHPHMVPFPLEVPESWRSCRGPPSQWDLHVEEISPNDMYPMCPPQPIYEFDFEKPSTLSLKGNSPILEVPITKSGFCHALVVWWETQLAPGVVLSTSPHSPPQWRDHWLQCVQVLPYPISVKRGTALKIQMHFDEYNIWFDVHHEKSEMVQHMSREVVERPVCTCGSHMVWNRVRLSMLNEEERTRILLSALKKVVREGDRVVVFSEGSLLPFMSVNIGAKKVFTMEDSGLSRRLVKKLVEENKVKEKVCVLEKTCTELTIEDVNDEKVDAIVGEPFFFTSLLPWHNLVFWYASTKSKPLLKDGGKIMPCGAVIKGIAVNFKDLHKIKLPVGVVEGFDLALFDDARGIAKEANPVISVSNDENVEPHPLWEYPSFALSETFPVMSFDFTSPVPKDSMITTSNDVAISNDREVHAIVLWMDYQLTEEDWLCRQGPLKEPVVGSQVVWSRTQRQAVVFFPYGQKVNFLKCSKLKFKSRFQTKSGNFEIDFECI